MAHRAQPGPDLVVKRIWSSTLHEFKGLSDFGNLELAGYVYMLRNDAVALWLSESASARQMSNFYLYCCFYLPASVYKLFTTAVYIHPRANVTSASSLFKWCKNCCQFDLILGITFGSSNEIREFHSQTWRQLALLHRPKGCWRGLPFSKSKQESWTCQHRGSLT